MLTRVSLCCLHRCWCWSLTRLLLLLLPLPLQCAPLEGMHAHQVACGGGFTLFLMKPDDKGLEALPVFESTAEDVDEGGEAEEEAEAPAKGGWAVRGNGKGRARAVLWLIAAV